MYEKDLRGASCFFWDGVACLVKIILRIKGNLTVLVLELYVFDLL